MMRTKGQGISLTVIVVAAVALLVLVVLSIIFIGRIGPFSKETASCETQQGQCVFGDGPSACLTENGGNGGTYVSGSSYTCDEGQVCCLPVGG